MHSPPPSARSLDIASWTVSVDKTRGRKSSQSLAVLQWQRGHRLDRDKPRPDATIEFKGPGGVISCVHALEISLQTDFTKVGRSKLCQMSAGKAIQLPTTAWVLANKPAYAGADVRYWYLCPWEPLPASQRAVLERLESYPGTDRVAITWLTLDHSEEAGE